MPVPVLIGPDSLPISIPPYNSPTIGAFLAPNGKYYQVTNKEASDGSTNFAAYESSDGGATFPTLVAAGPSTPGPAWVEPPRGNSNLVYCAYTDDGQVHIGNLFVVAFDLSNPTAFGTPNQFTGITTGDNIFSIFVVERGDGALVLGWDQADNADTFSQCVAAVYASGSWSAAIVMSGAAFSALGGIVVNGVGNAVFNWWTYTPGQSIQRRLELFCSILTGTAAGSSIVMLLDASNVFTQVWHNIKGIYDTASDSLLYTIVQAPPGPVPYEVDLLIGTPSANPTFSLVQVAVSTDLSDVWDSSTIAAVSAGKTSVSVGLSAPDALGHPTSNSNYSFPLQAKSAGFIIMWTNEGLSDQILMSTASAPSGAWSAYSVFWDKAIDPPTPTVTQEGLFGVSLRTVAAAPSSPVIVVNPSPGGPTPTIPFPNGFDLCLARDYRLYDCVDRELLSCAKKPECFLYDERQWGGNYDDAEEIGQGPPTGSIAFNPTGQVSLPAPIDGDVIVFSTRVPIGYDGIILGQFHGYYSVPIPGPITSVFVEGSGDIRWRLAINRRFAKDCGDITVTLGTLRTFSIIAGGLQVRSGDLIQYIVNVPNTSGGLAPGVGSVIAGLHGWFWPRK